MGTKADSTDSRTAATDTADSRRELRDTLLAQVDAFAQRLAPVYHVLHWRWARGRDYNERYIPNEADIRAHLVHFINEAAERESGFSDCAGLQIAFTEDLASMTFQVGVFAERDRFGAVDVYADAAEMGA